MVKKERELKGVAGWLTLFGLRLVFASLTVFLILLYMPSLFFKFLYFIELILLIYTSYSLNRERKITKILAIIGLWLPWLMVLVVWLKTMVWPSPLEIKGIFFGVFESLIWTIYFLRSKRVKATLVK